MSLGYWALICSASPFLTTLRLFPFLHKILNNLLRIFIIILIMKRIKNLNLIMIYILKNEQIGNDIVVPVFTTSGSSIGQTYSLPLIHQAAERQADLAQRLGISHQTVNIARRAFLSTENLVMFLQRKPRQTPPVPAKITGEQEAQIIALACSPAPKGYAR